MTIAMFDSGLGGLTVLSEALHRLPQESYLYYADTLHTPYGTKEKEAVRRYIHDAVDHIAEHSIHALVIACNTATSITIDELRAKYHFPIVGMEPAVKPAVEISRVHGKRVLVMATALTLREKKFHQLVHRVDDMSIVDSLPMPELVTFAEQLEYDGERVRSYLERQLSAFDLNDYGTVVLGCTHFSFYSQVLSSILPTHISLIDGNRGTVSRLMGLLQREPILLGQQSAKNDVSFMCSDGSREYINKMKQALQWLEERRTR